MGAALIPLQIASSAMTILGQVQSGRAANASAKAEAQRREQAANRERALGQRRAADKRRAGRVAQSNALARSAAQGGGADPTSRSLLARLEGDYERSALAALAGGEARGRDQDFAAGMSRFRGKRAAQQANLGALKEGISFATKYGDETLDKFKEWTR